jgi:hypothetical protein
MFTRREFLTATAMLGGLSALSRFVRATEKPLPPIRRITNGPKFHWRAYYDHYLFDPSNRFVLSHEVDFEGRSPTPDDTIRVGMVDLQDNDRWIELGSTKAWNWQQGSLLQWIPGTESTVTWNDREKDRFVSRILDVKTKEIVTLDGPIFALTPDGQWGFYPDFRRLNHIRPGYGYGGIADPNADVPAPDDAGIWRIEIATGKSELILPFSKLAAWSPPEGGYAKEAKHWFNQIIVAPDGRRFLFLHRWRVGQQMWGTRLITANVDGSGLFILNPHGMTSHLVWRDANHVLAWAKHPSHGNRFYVFTDKTDSVEVIGDGVLTVDGHCTYLPKTNGDWILNDTDTGDNCPQHLHLYHCPTNRIVPLADFHPPKQYDGEWRCDLHPSADSNGHFVTIDSVHENMGRQVYLIDIRLVV